MATYLITGASRGLGLEFTRQLSSRPISEVSKVFATARGDAPSLKELSKNSSGRVVVIKLDSTDEATIKAAAAEVEARLDGKGLDVLINNAGISQFSPKGVAQMSVSPSRYLA
jgi:NAD(P)-dependent dehydrogenase (short-subunit alcohol dehydrogenase family)